MRKFLILSSICSFFLGCNTTTNPADAGSDAAPPIGDGGRDGGPPIVDGGNDVGTHVAEAGIDAGSDANVDAAVACSSATCSGTHACVRGVCVLTCGADTTGFDAALAAGLTVVQSVCRTPIAITVVGSNVYELDKATAGLVTTFTLTRWARGAEVPTTTTVGTATFTGMTGDMTFAGGYVAVAPDEMHALFGYTTAPMTGSGRMSVGGVFDMATSSGTVAEVPANNNFDATFLDATHFVIDGAPMAGQGLYRGTTAATTVVQVASHLGDFSGSVEVFGASVLAGGSSFGSAWADGSTDGDRVVVFDAASIGTASSPIDASTLTQLVMPSAFELLSGGRAASVHYGGSGIDRIELHTLTRSSTGAVSVAAPTNLTTGGVFSSATAAGADIALGFQGGLLFVR